MRDPALSSQQQQFFEDYSYTPGGLMNGRGLHLTRTTTDTRGTLTNNYVWNVGVTYNTEGSPLTVKYPDLIDFSGNTVTNHTVTYTYDGLNRPSTYQGDLLGNSLGDSFNAITGVTYNAASQPTATHYSFQRGICCGNDFWEYRSYNAMNQVTAINNGIGVSQVYGYTQGANNGQISSMTDYYLNQTITYGYDALKRLVSANAQGGTNAWGQAYQYDGFGNLNTKQVTAGSAMSWSRLIDPATNRVGGECYDANGNAGCNSTYDVANRLTGSGLAGQSGDTYMYNAGNQRVSVVRDSFQTIYFYGARGEKLATFNVGEGSYPTYMANNVYFGGRLVERGNSFVGVDRLGTVRSAGGYFPYGEEMTSPPAAGDTEKFATYTRDSSTTGLDYANQRFYSSVAGRFMSPDPYRNSGGPSDPGSWNRYAYTRNDPVSRVDPRGTCDKDTNTSVNVCDDNPPLVIVPSPVPPSKGPDTPDQDSPRRGGPDDQIPGTIQVGGANQGGFQQSVIQIAAQTLGNIIDPDCQTWLSGGEVNNFSTFLANALGAIGHGSISRVDAAGNSISGYGTINAVTGGFNNLSIVVNDSGAFFNSAISTDSGNIAGGTLKAQVFILLHEFAHLNQAPGFLSDGRSVTAGDINNRQIEEHCSKTLKAQVLK